MQAALRQTDSTGNTREGMQVVQAGLRQEEQADQTKEQVQAGSSCQISPRITESAAVATKESLMKDMVKDTMRLMELEVYAHHDAVLEILATEDDRELYIDGYLEAYDEHYQRQPNGNAKWASLYRDAPTRTNLDNVKKFLDVKEYGLAKIALVNVVAPQANASCRASYTMGPAYDRISNQNQEIRYKMIRHTYEKEMLPAIGRLLLELKKRGIGEECVRIIVPIIGSAIYSPFSGHVDMEEDCKRITQIIVESFMSVEELNKECIEIELTYPSHWSGKNNVEEHMRKQGFLKGLKASVKELPNFRNGPAGDITAIIHRHMTDVAQDRLFKIENHRFLILGGAGNFLRFKGGAGKDAKVQRARVTDPEELKRFRKITAKVVEGAQPVEGAEARFAKRGWALRSGFQGGGGGLEEFTIYGLLGSRSGREGMPRCM